MTELEPVLGMDDILDYLPHRYPFIFVDRVISIDREDGSIVGLKNVTINEPFFQGHFPDKPIMPGVLIVEALAQVSGILASVMKDIKPKVDGYIYYLAGADNTRFKRPVVPGDSIFLHAQVTHERRDTMKFKSQAKVQDILVCATELLVVARKI